MCHKLIFPPPTHTHTQDDVLANLDFDELNITSQEDDILDEVEAAGNVALVTDCWHFINFFC